MLQQPLKDPDGILALARGLNEAAGARAAYDGYLQLVSRLTNPLVGDQPDLRALLERLERGKTGSLQGDFRFLPPSKAHETDLVKKLYGDRPIPEGFDLIEEMVRRIRAGTLSLEPGPDSGWYDYQTWALEPLVIPEKMPEAQKLKLDPEYRKQLLELLKGVLALTRETHIKQLEIPAAGASLRREPALIIEPQLSAEPTFSYYLRRAVSYRFVENVLEQSFGASYVPYAEAARVGPFPGAAGRSLATLPSRSGDVRGSPGGCTQGRKRAGYARAEPAPGLPQLAACLSSRAEPAAADHVPQHEADEKRQEHESRRGEEPHQPSAVAEMHEVEEHQKRLDRRDGECGHRVERPQVQISHRHGDGGEHNEHDKYHEVRPGGDRRLAHPCLPMR